MNIFGSFPESVKLSKGSHGPWEPILLKYKGPKALTLCLPRSRVPHLVLTRA